MTERKTVTRGTEDRFWAKVVKGDGCWIWTGGRNRQGYGVFNVVHERPERAHRVAYELLVGPVPAGLILDHLCRNRGCVKPTHLEPVTNRENILRGVGPTARNAVATHCKRGHPLHGENMRIEGSFRRCRACGALRQQAYRTRRRLARTIAA